MFCPSIKKNLQWYSAPSQTHRSASFNPQSRLKRITNSKMSNGTIKSWVKGDERRQRILNETSLMRVEFKHGIKRFPRGRSRERKPMRCRRGTAPSPRTAAPGRATPPTPADLAKQPPLTDLPALPPSNSNTRRLRNLMNEIGAHFKIGDKTRDRRQAV